MALTKATVREILSSAGVDAEHLSSAVSKIIDGHVSSIEALRDEISEKKEEIEKYRKEADKITGLNKQLEEANKKAESLADLQKKAEEYDNLEKQFNDYKAEQNKKARSAKQTELIKDLLKDMKINSDEGVKLGVKWYSNKVEFDEDGKLSNGKDLRKEIAEDLKGYVSKTEAKGADTATPPGNKGKGMTKEQIDAIEDTAERQKAMAANLDLYGIS